MLFRSKYEPYSDWGVYADYNITDTEATITDSSYTFDKFKTDSANEFTFTHLGSNLYYIQNKSTQKYLKISSGILGYGDSPEVLSVTANANGSILIHSFNYYVLHEWDYFYATNVSNPSTKQSAIMWL